MKKKEKSALKKLAKSNTLTALNYVMIKDGWVTASNLETTVSFKCPNIEGTGLALAELFVKADFDSGRFLPDFSLELTKGKATWRVPGMDPEEYPIILEKGRKIGQFNDVELLRTVAPFASKDEIRLEMNGVFVSKTRVTATDAHRIITLKRKGNTVLHGTIIPNGTIPLLYEDSYTVFKSKDVGRAYIHLIGKNQKVIFRPVDGRFPRFAAIFPHKVKATCTVDRKMLLDTVGRAIQCANKVTFCGDFVFEAGMITVSSGDLESGTEYSENLFAKFSEKDNRFKVGLNLSYVAQILKCYKQETVRFSLIDDNRAVFINEIMLMPVMLEDSGWKEKIGAEVDAPVRFTEKEIEELLPPLPDKTKEETDEAPPAPPAEESPISDDEKIGNISDEALPAAEEEPVSDPEEVKPEEQQPAEVPETPTPEKTPEVEGENRPIVLDYKEKSICVLGDTLKYRRKFKAAHGVWIPHLTIAGTKVPGWVFSKKRRAQVEDILK